MKWVFIKLLFKLEYWLIKYTNNKSNFFRKVVIDKSQLIAAELFPDNTVGENRDTSVPAVHKIIFNKEINKDDEHHDNILILVDKLNKNKEVTNLISDYFLAQSYAFSLGKLSKAAKLTTAQEYEDEYFIKAKGFNPEAERFTDKSYKVKTKSLKKYHKKILIELKEIFDKKIAIEKEKIIEPIVISTSDITLFFSLFSTLFVVSGYFYNHQIFQYFGVNSDSFFSISDYLSTSVSLVLTPLIWSLVSTVIYVLGANRGLGTLLTNRQLGIKPKEKPPYGIAFTLITLNTLNVNALITGQEGVDKASSMVMFLNCLVVGFYYLEKMPFHYFKNPFKVILGFVVLLGFSFNLNKLTSDAIELYQLDTYQPAYTAEFTKKEISERSLEFISINSNYIFMRNKQTLKMEIYPKTFVEKLTPTNLKPKKEMTINNLLITWIELLVFIYEFITNK